MSVFVRVYVCVCVAHRGAVATDLNHHKDRQTHKMLVGASASSGLPNHTSPLLSQSLFFLFFTNPPTHSSFPIAFSCSFRNKAYSLNHLLLINRVLREGLNGRGGERHTEDEGKINKESKGKNMVVGGTVDYKQAKREYLIILSKQ